MGAQSSALVTSLHCILALAVNPVQMVSYEVTNVHDAGAQDEENQG